MNKLNVYTRFVKVYFAVTVKQVGNMPANTAILGISDPDHEKCRLKLCDWCGNGQISHRDVKITSGYVVDNDSLTNYLVYDPCRQTPKLQYID